MGFELIGSMATACSSWRIRMKPLAVALTTLAMRPERQGLPMKQARSLEYHSLATQGDGAVANCCCAPTRSAGCLQFTGTLRATALGQCCAVTVSTILST